MNFEEAEAIKGLPWQPTPRAVSAGLMSIVRVPLPPPVLPQEVNGRPSQVMGDRSEKRRVQETWADARLLRMQGHCAR